MLSRKLDVYLGAKKAPSGVVKSNASESGDEASIENLDVSRVDDDAMKTGGQLLMRTEARLSLFFNGELE